MHALPNLAIQLHLVRFIRLCQVTRRDPRTERTGIELVEGPCVRQMDKRRRVRASSESVPQGRGAGVVLAEWGEAQDSFDGAQHGRGRVERAVDSITASVRGRDQENRAVRVHVVGAILRVDSTFYTTASVLRDRKSTRLNSSHITI